MQLQSAGFDKSLQRTPERTTGLQLVVLAAAEQPFQAAAAHGPDDRRIRRSVGKLRQIEQGIGGRMPGADHQHTAVGRSEEHTSELQSLMRISYAVFCLK